jgi:hypothetical protein
MGKRELLLLVVFVVLGVGVYQVSAPAAPADGPGFSLSRLVQMARSHFSGPAVRRTVTRTATLTPADGVTTLDLGGVRGAIVVEGADRADIEVRVEVMLGGMDEADLNRQAQALQVALKSEGTVAHAAVAFDQTGRPPRFELHVLMPRRLKAQISGRGSAEVSGVAGVHLDEFRGELTTEDLRGPVTGEMRDGRAEFGSGATLELRTERGRLRAEAPASVTLDSAHASIDIVDPAGPITLKQEQCRIEIRGTGGPVKVTGEGGTIVLRQVTHPLTIEAERLTVTAELDVPVPTVVTIENDDVEVTLPRSGGVQLEATVSDGELRLPDGLTATIAEPKQSFAGTIAGGGPLVKLTLDRGTMRVRGRVGQPGT